jgi:hypothetical protein
MPRMKCACIIPKTSLHALFPATSRCRFWPSDDEVRVSRGKGGVGGGWERTEESLMRRFGLGGLFLFIEEGTAWKGRVRDW